MPGLEGEGGDADGGGDEAGGPQSVDDVLAEVDAALQAAEEALEAGRSPSAQGWPSMGRASSGSVNGGVGGNGSPAAASSGSLQSALKPTRLHLSALR